MNVGKTTIRNNEIRNNAPVPRIGDTGSRYLKKKNYLASILSTLNV